MKVSAHRSKDSDTAITAPIAGKVAESVTNIMTLVGIKKLACKKIRVAEFERIIADVTMIDNTPDEIRASAMLIKDALASIIASTGVVDIDITFEDKEPEDIEKSFKTQVEMYTKANQEQANGSAESTEIKTENGAPVPDLAAPAPAPSTVVPTATVVEDVPEPIITEVPQNGPAA